MKYQIQSWMHKTLKQLLLIIIIPTIFWGLLAYSIFLYYYHGDMTLEGIIPGLVFPFWLSHLFLLIGYILTMMLVYLLVRKKEIEKEFWKTP